MKITNLMFGDWVRFKENYPQKELQGKIAKVRGINGRVDVRTLDGEYHNSVHPNWLEPIPITPEILADNGFERHPLWHHCTLYHDDGSKIYIPLACGGGIEYVSVYKHFDDLTKRDIDIQIPIYYVHQLQHLLRLCDIEMEITLTD